MTGPIFIEDKTQGFKNALNCSLLVLITMLLGCSNPKKHSLFKVIPSDKSGIQFANNLHPTAQFNLFDYMYYYNGGGIGAADFNNDGLIDLFFTSNQGSNALYLNKGHLKFEDVTQQANIKTDSGWSTGVSVVDINNDGLMDIYICKVNKGAPNSFKNQLLVCKGIKNGVPFYEDEAKQYGIDFSGYCTQAVFFDYDGDGDLDLFLLNHAISNEGHYAARSAFINKPDQQAGDHIYRNNGNGTFTDATPQTKIYSNPISYGLGVCVSDINMDGSPDIYVGNDFHENDYLYINQKDGTFKDAADSQLQHTSKYTMGVDVADISNDALPEIISLDMMPYNPVTLKRSVTEENYNVFNYKLSLGYNPQYARNNLQFNRGNGHFSEIGFYAGIYATDWSWAPLFADFNNDGLKDLFISNGIPKRMNDIDYIDYISNTAIQGKLQSGAGIEKDTELVARFPEIKIPNKFYLNTGAVSFKDITDSIDDNPPGFSNGAVYADLDNDGDLDIVVNNINGPVVLYENQINDSAQNQYASVSLHGPAQNINALGAKVILFVKDSIRSYENYPVHGFQSSMQVPLLIGLKNTIVDSAVVIWPDNSCQHIDLANKKNLDLHYTPGLPKFNYEALLEFKKHPAYFDDVTARTGLHYEHTENVYDEFNLDPLMPRMQSAKGPALCVGDINNDGLDDVFIGAAKGGHSAIFVQQANGLFTKTLQPALDADSLIEDNDAVFVDVNNDHYLDLVIATGGDEYFGMDPRLQPLLYLNDGKGRFVKQENAFPGVNTTQSVVCAGDFNGDGAIDLFIGSSNVPGSFGMLPTSYLFLNNGHGQFRAAYQKELQSAGFISDAKWADVDNDGKKELVICAEWGGVDAFEFNGNSCTRKSLIPNKGWWSCLLVADFNQDQKPDLFVGNMGQNTPLKANENEAVNLYFNSFNNSPKPMGIMTYYVGGKEIPFSFKIDLDKQMPVLKKNFLYAQDFANASITDLLGADAMNDAKKYQANDFNTSLFFNKDGVYKLADLPFQAQLSICNTAIAIDANEDGFPDILLGGNNYFNNVQIGRQDADYGTLLINKGNGGFAYASLNPLLIKGVVQKIRPIKINNKQALLLAKNNAALQVLQLK
ncbi:MAG: VCBS repeat-containing protein [Niabella sp.]|nr:VCBS repeat-containing protein [Niabella sp.]